MKGLKDTHKKYTRRSPFRFGSVSTLASVCLAVVFCGPTGMFKFQRPPVHGPGVKKPCRYSLTPGCSISIYFPSIRYFLNSMFHQHLRCLHSIFLQLHVPSALALSAIDIASTPRSISTCVVCYRYCLNSTFYQHLRCLLSILPQIHVPSALALSTLDIASNPCSVSTCVACSRYKSLHSNSIFPQLHVPSALALPALDISSTPCSISTYVPSIRYFFSSISDTLDLTLTSNSQ